MAALGTLASTKRHNARIEWPVFGEKPTLERLSDSGPKCPFVADYGSSPVDQRGLQVRPAPSRAIARKRPQYRRLS
jgi:hypothetical protein